MFDCTLVGEAVQNLYGIKSETVKRLHSYEDVNFLVKDITGKEFIARFMKETKYTGIVDDADDVQEYLHRCGIAVPGLIRNKHGQKRSMKIIDDGRVKSRYFLQLSTFLPGTAIFEANLSVDQSLKVGNAVGKLCGLITKYLRDYQAIPHGKDDEYVWYTANFCGVKKYAEYVKDEELFEIVSFVLQKFEERVLPRMHELPKTFVHGDFSNTNIILMGDLSLKENSPLKSSQEKLGLIDFEDCHYGPSVFDLGTCVAYMMSSMAPHGENAMKIARNIFTNYLKVCALSEAEKAVVFWAVMARLVTSYVMSRYNISRDPSNTEYFEVQSSKCPAILKMLWRMGEDCALKAFLDCV